MLNFVFV